MARLGGFAPSSVAQVKRGLGVGAKTGPGFARALGFKSYDELKSEAYRWWEKHGRAGADAAAIPLSDAMREAVEAVLLLKQGTRAQLETILAAYTHPRFRERDRDLWVLTLLSELRADAEAARNERLAREAMQAGQKRVRGAQRKRKAVPGASPPLAERKRA